MYSLIYMYNACVSDADHEARKQAKRQFTNHKLLQPQKVTAGLHSTPRCCYMFL
jgi:hypothetical protein